MDLRTIKGHSDSASSFLLGAPAGSCEIEQLFHCELPDAIGWLRNRCQRGDRISSNDIVIMTDNGRCPVVISGLYYKSLAGSANRH